MGSCLSNFQSRAGINQRKGFLDGKRDNSLTNMTWSLLRKQTKSVFFFSFSVKFNDTEIKQYALFLPSSVTSVLNGRGFSCIRTTQVLHYIFIAVQTSKIYDFAFWWGKFIFWRKKAGYRNFNAEN